MMPQFVFCFNFLLVSLHR